MNRNLKLGIWIVLIVIFQTTLCRYISVKGIFPDIVFVFVVCFAIMEEKFSYSTVIPIICGLLIDFLGRRTLGVNVIIYSYSSLFCFGLGEHFFKEKLSFALPMVFLLSFLCEFVFFVLRFYIAHEASIFEAVKVIIFPFAVYNTLITFIIYPLIKLTLYRYDEKSFMRMH
ncbi:MAG: rod shape-determining protein MreD [Clostridia bacterium]|nr:rod shape-determining protein MreD [Clostridia bacterium]